MPHDVVDAADVDWVAPGGAGQHPRRLCEEILHVPAHAHVLILRAEPRPTLTLTRPVGTHTHVVIIKSTSIHEWTMTEPMSRINWLSFGASHHAGSAQHALRHAHMHALHVHMGHPPCGAHRTHMQTTAHSLECCSHTLPNLQAHPAQSCRPPQPTLQAIPPAQSCWHTPASAPHPIL